MCVEVDIVIIGSGPSGLGTASHLKRPFLILEAEQSAGGLMRSKEVKGYIFDWAGHIFFSKIQRIVEWISDLMGENFHWQNRESWVFSKSVYTRYPFQANTYGLPVPVVKECLMGLIEATMHNQNTEPANFREWILQTYGTGIAKHFMFPYNEKLWARDLSSMDHLWLRGRVPKPGLEEFIEGALGPGRKDLGPNARFGYPLNGGMQSVVNKLVQPLSDRILTGRRVRAVHPTSGVVETESGDRFKYNHLVVTAPLPEVVRMTSGIPDQLRTKAESLAFLGVLCVNVGIRRQKLTEKHWIYFPESSFLFHRIFVQGNASPHVCPEGCFSYTAEITYNDQKKIDFSTAGEQTVEGLIAARLMAPDDPVDVIDLIDIPVGYIVPTHHHEAIVDEISNWYESHNIHLSGRFAQWRYYNMDHALDAGWNLAEKLETL